MNGGVFEGLLVIGLALLLIVVGVIQMRRWDARTWQEPTDVPTLPPPSSPANHRRVPDAPLPYVVSDERSTSFMIFTYRFRDSLPPPVIVATAR